MQKDDFIVVGIVVFVAIFAIFVLAYDDGAQTTGRAHVIAVEEAEGVSVLIDPNRNPCGAYRCGPGRDGRIQCTAAGDKCTCECTGNNCYWKWGICPSNTRCMDNHGCVATQSGLLQ